MRCKMKTDYIINGDALEFLKSIPDKSVDFILTDPPYDIYSKNIKQRQSNGSRINLQQASFMNELSDADIVTGFDFVSHFNEYRRILKKVNVVLFCNKRLLFAIIVYLEINYKALYNLDILCWHKANCIPACNNYYVNDCEWALHIHEAGLKWKQVPYQYKKKVFLDPVNIYDKKRFAHPTIKPLPIFKTILMNNTEEGDLVLDPFMGSGTTAVACKELKRHYIGSEINPKFFNISQDRLNGIDITGNIQLFEG